MTDQAIQPGPAPSPVSGRVWACVRCDLILAWRNGFFVAALFVTGVHLALLWWMGSLLSDWIMALVLLEVFVFNGFYFSAALVLMQKSESSLIAQFLSPLTPSQWVVSRCLVLSALAMGECLALTLPLWTPNLLWLLLSALLLTCLLCQLGVAFVRRYRSFSEFLMPSSVFFLLLLVPALDLVNIWSSPLLFLHPLMPGMMLLKAAVAQPAATPEFTELALWVSLGLAWLVPGHWLARNAAADMATDS